MTTINQKDGEFWALFFDREHRRLCAVALAWLGDVDNSLDLVQDVLIRIIEQARYVDAPLAYCLRAVRNAAIDRLRRERRMPAIMPMGPGCESMIDVDAARKEEQRDAAEFVQAALRRLKPEQREVIVLKTYAALTLAEIADLLSVPQGTAATHYRRGIEAMQKMYRKQVDDAA